MSGEIENTAGLQKPRHESGQRKDDEKEDDATNGILEDEPETYGLKVTFSVSLDSDVMLRFLDDLDSLRVYRRKYEGLLLREEDKSYGGKGLKACMQYGGFIILEIKRVVLDR